MGHQAVSGFYTEQVSQGLVVGGGVTVHRHPLGDIAQLVGTNNDIGTSRWIVVPACPRAAHTASGASWFLGSYQPF